MNMINNGGPAFPVWELNGKDQPEMTGFGMTLRDYFAAKFAAAMMTNIDYQREVGGPTIAERVAAIAYRMADAMLKAREARREQRDEARVMADKLTTELAACDVARPSTPVGWSDTDWIKHLQDQEPHSLA